LENLPDFKKVSEIGSTTLLFKFIYLRNRVL
jgi:hypothetical protein